MNRKSQILITQLITLLFLVVSLSSCSSDQSELKNSTKGVLKAFKSKDFKKLASFCEGPNKEVFIELAEKGDDSPKMKRVTKGWRWEAVQKWDGKVGDVRYGNFDDKAGHNTEAYVQFGKISDEEIVVVAFNRVDNKWFFEDINSPDKKDFTEMSTDFKKEK